MSWMAKNDSQVLMEVSFIFIALGLATTALVALEPVGIPPEVVGPGMFSAGILGFVAGGIWHLGAGR